MNTYSTLKTSIASWLAQDNLTANLDDFIDIAESRANQYLRVRAMETSADITCTAGVDYVALPTGYLELRRLHVDGSPQYPLTYYTPAQLAEVSNTATRPRFFTIEGDNIKFAGNADDAYVLKALYYKAFTALSDSNTSNWLTSNHPQVLLYGALEAAAEFIHDDEQKAKWGSLFRDELDRVATSDRNGKYGPAPAIVSRGRRP